jgi:hypothetical protein
VSERSQDLQDLKRFVKAFVILATFRLLAPLAVSSLRFGQDGYAPPFSLDTKKVIPINH